MLCTRLIRGVYTAVKSLATLPQPFWLQTLVTSQFIHLCSIRRIKTSKTFLTRKIIKPVWSFLRTIWTVPSVIKVLRTSRVRLVCILTTGRARTLYGALGTFSFLRRFFNPVKTFLTLVSTRLLVWMFYCRKLNNRINRLHERALFKACLWRQHILFQWASRQRWILYYSYAKYPVISDWTIQSDEWSLSGNNGKFFPPESK